MFGLSITEVVVILVVALIVLGPDKLPEVARTLGKTLGELRRTLDDMKREFVNPIADLREEPMTPSRTLTASDCNCETQHCNDANTPSESKVLSETKTEEAAPVQSPTIESQSSDKH